MMRRFVESAVDIRTLQQALVTPFNLDELLVVPRARNIAVIRSLCANAYLGKGTALCRVLGRYKMLVDTGDVGLSIHLLLDGHWEMEHTEATLQLLKPGMKAVDIGANLGYYSLLMAEIVGPKGSVHAFEPNPALSRRLATSVEINGFADRVTVYNVALSDETGEGILRFPPNQPKNGSLVAHLSPTSDTMRVALDRFDAIPQLADADYVKIDVEGAEEALWRGMAGLLSSGRPLTIVLEFSADRNVDAVKFLDDVLSGGFSLSVIHATDGIIPTTRAQVLDQPKRLDQLLVLRR